MQPGLASGRDRGGVVRRSNAASVKSVTLVEAAVQTSPEATKTKDAEYWAAVAGRTDRRVWAVRDVGPTSTLRDEVVVSGQSLVAARGQILVAPTTCRNGAGRTASASSAT